MPPPSPSPSLFPLPQSGHVALATGHAAATCSQLLILALGPPLLATSPISAPLTQPAGGWGCAQAGEIALAAMADLALRQYPPPMALRMPARDEDGLGWGAGLEGLGRGRRGCR